MIDPEDNVKAALAEVLRDRAKRKARWAIAWMLLGFLVVHGCLAEAVLTAHSNWMAVGLMGTAASALISGVLIGRAEDAAQTHTKAADVCEKWQTEIAIQNREVEREHEDGEPA